MIRPIELTGCRDLGAVSELSASIWSAQEPGFQIEGVQDIDELMMVLESLQTTVSQCQAVTFNFDSAYPTMGFKHFLSQPEQAHIDDSLQGIAVHHNISETIPIKLGFALSGLVFPDLWDGYNAIEVRNGTTTPGRLTVFSEGWSGYMPKALHLFKRHHNRPNKWARYGQEKDIDNRANNVRQIATEAFELISDYQ